jgi:hypothetical protein
MNEGLVLSSLLEGLVSRVVVAKYEDNALKTLNVMIHFKF